MNKIDSTKYMIVVKNEIKTDEIVSFVKCNKSKQYIAI